MKIYVLIEWQGRGYSPPIAAWPYIPTISELMNKADIEKATAIQILKTLKGEPTNDLPDEQATSLEIFELIQ